MEKEVTVKCSFCGKEVPCPVDMVNAEKHSCMECFKSLNKEWKEEDFEKVHVAVPKDKLDEVMPDIFIQTLMEKVFPRIWQEKKLEFKEMSKKEVSEVMFAAGAEFAMDLLNKMVDEDMEDIDDEEDDEEDEDVKNGK